MLMHTPSAKTIPDIKGSRQEGEIRNTRNYRLLLVRRWLQGPACARTQRAQYLRAGRRRMFWSRWPERGRAPYTDLLKHGIAVAANRVLIIRRVPATLFEKKFGSLKVVSFTSLKRIISWMYFLDISCVARFFTEEKRAIRISNYNYKMAIVLDEKSCLISCLDSEINFTVIS